MRKFVVSNGPEIRINWFHTLVRLRFGGVGSEALEAHLRRRVFRRSVPLRVLAFVLLTAIQGVEVFGFLAGISARQDYMTENSRMRCSLAI